MPTKVKLRPLIIHERLDSSAAQSPLDDSKGDPLGIQLLREYSPSELFNILSLDDVLGHERSCSGRDSCVAEHSGSPRDLRIDDEDGHPMAAFSSFSGVPQVRAMNHGCRFFSASMDSPPQEKKDDDTSALVASVSH